MPKHLASLLLIPAMLAGLLLAQTARAEDCEDCVDSETNQVVDQGHTDMVAQATQLKNDVMGCSDGSHNEWSGGQLVIGNGAKGDDDDNCPNGITLSENGSAVGENEHMLLPSLASFNGANPAGKTQYFVKANEQAVMACAIQFKNAAVPMQSLLPEVSTPPGTLKQNIVYHPDENPTRPDTFAPQALPVAFYSGIASDKIFSMPALPDGVKKFDAQTAWNPGGGSNGIGADDHGGDTKSFGMAYSRELGGPQYNTMSSKNIDIPQAEQDCETIPDKGACKAIESGAGAASRGLSNIKATRNAKKLTGSNTIRKPKEAQQSLAKKLEKKQNPKEKPCGDDPEKNFNQGKCDS